MQQNRCQSCNRTGDNHATERVQVYTVAENTGHIQYKHTLVDTSVIHWPGLHMSTHYKFDMKIWIRINYEKKHVTFIEMICEDGKPAHTTD